MNQKKNTLIVTAIFGLLFAGSIKAQYTQTIKGSVYDHASQISLPGVNVILLSSNPTLGSITDQDGKFRIANVPVGRYDIQVSYIGYETTVIPSVMVTSGKEVIVTANLKEAVALLNEVTVKARSKDKAINSMSTLSVRTFSVEETGRYAGGLDDPGRLVSTFAGVSDGTLQSNGIVVRGNAPFGTGYRIEGLSVDNPNHFAGEDFLGGGFVSILSKHVLSNSDFLTGAFPAEYGNAISSVFDMNLRTGNAEKNEHTFQAGIMGIDLASEGPFEKGRNASYVFNYRYSTFGIIKNILPETTGLPVYQDLSFKCNFPTKIGVFSLWGTGGIESYNSGNETDRDITIIDDKSSTGIVGLKHRLLIGNSAYITTSFGINATTKANILKKLFSDGSYYWDEKMDDVYGKYMFSTSFNKKISSRLFLRTGIEYENMFYSINNQKSISIPIAMENIVDQVGTTNLWQVYLQIKYNLLRNININAGVHGQYLTLNNSNSTEPRVGIQWTVNERNTLCFAYGRHSQIQNQNVYFIEQASEAGIILPNKNLGFMKADHFILGYDLSISKNIRLKIEPYYQSLFDVPVEENTSFSIINLIDLNTFNKRLINEGTGRNIGIDFTFERFFQNNYYYMITASLFDSKFKGGDGIERNTIYNKNFIANILGGREFIINKKNILSVNSRMYINFGNWISPVDYSNLTNPAAFFVTQQPTNYRFDLSASYTVNHEKFNTIWSLQIINVLNSKCPMEPIEDLFTNQFYYKYEGIVLPSISWKIEF